MRMLIFGGKQGQFAVDIEQPFDASHVDVSAFAQQTGFGEIFVLNGTVRFAEQYKFLFFDQPGEKHIVCAKPYLALLVAYDECHFRE